MEWLEKSGHRISALLAFVLLELMAFIGGVAVFFLGLVMVVDLPFFAVSEELPSEFGWWRARRMLAFSRFNSGIGKTCRGALFPVSGDFRPVLCGFGSLDARMPAPAIGCCHKKGYSSTVF